MRDSWARHLETCSYNANVIGLFTVLLLYVCNTVACKLVSSVAEDAVGTACRHNFGLSLSEAPPKGIIQQSRSEWLMCK